MAGERQRFGAVPVANDDDAIGEEAGEEETGNAISASRGLQPQSSQSAFSHKPTWAQTRYLIRGLKQPGGKLPLFDEEGQEIDVRTIRSCIERGWAEPWFKNPIKKDWLVCKLTAEGFRVLGGEKPKG